MNVNIYSNRVVGFYSIILCVLTTIYHFIKKDKNTKFNIDNNILHYGPWSNFFLPINEFDTSFDLNVQDSEVWYTYVKNDSVPSMELIKGLTHHALPYLKYSKAFNSYVDSFILPETFLTIHFRGYMGNAHNKHVSEICYVNFIKDNYSNIKNILICTDDSNAFNNFSRLLPDKNIVSNFTNTRPGGEVHIYEPLINKQLLGFQVMRDSLFMSKSVAVVGKESNVSTFARVLNNALAVHYLY